MRYALSIWVLLFSGVVSAFASVDPALLALVPSGAKLVSGVQLVQARSSEFGQYVLRRIDTEDDSFRQFTEETGFDPRHDLDEFVFASTGSDAGGHFAIVARGSFDQNRIRAKAKASGGVVQTYRGVDLILCDRNEHQGAGFAFLDGGIAVMADDTTLREIVRNRETATHLDPVLQDEIEKVSAENDAWFVSALPGSFLASHMDHDAKQPMQRAQALQSILVSSGGMHFGDVVAFSFDAKTRSAQDAVSLADVLRFGASMVQMQRQADSRAGIIASAIDKMTITTSGSSLHASLSLSEKNLEEFVGAPAKTADRARR